MGGNREFNGLFVVSTHLQLYSIHRYPAQNPECRSTKLYAEGSRLAIGICDKSSSKHQSTLPTKQPVP